VRKNIGGLKFEYWPGAAPNFDEKNPLNQVRPITVNYYFKTEVPGPTQYDPQRPQT